MFSNQASGRLHTGPGRVQTVPGRRETDDGSAHLARRRNWVNDARRVKAKAVMAGASPEAVVAIRRPTVSALVSTTRAERLEHIYQTVAGQQDVQVQLVILTLGFCPGDAHLQRLAREHGIDDVLYLYLPENVPSGESFNYCVRAADGDVVAMIDDEDHYGPHYLSDQLYSLEYSGADIVDKQAHYIYLEKLDATLLQSDACELSFTGQFTIPTVLAGRDVLAANPLRPFGADGDRGGWSPEAKDLKVYSADRFNYFSVRLGVRDTSQMPDSTLLSSGRFQFFGSPEPRIDI